MGTLSGRQIKDTIEGFEKYYYTYADTLDLTYDIVGDGLNDELYQLKKLVEQKGLSKVVNLPGYIHQSCLENYYHKCNVGVSYIPINDIFPSVSNGRIMRKGNKYIIHPGLKDTCILVITVFIDEDIGRIVVGEMELSVKDK